MHKYKEIYTQYPHSVGQLHKLVTYSYFSNSYKLNVANGFIVFYNIYTFVNPHAIGTKKLPVASPKICTYYNIGI